MSFTQKVFFYTTSQEGSAEGAYFQDLIVNLAEGFQEIGVRYYASNNYWRLAPETDKCLLQFNPNVTHHDCDIVVLERQWYEENRSLPKDLFDSSRKYITVYLDCLDGLRTYSWLPEFRQFDFIFKSHCNKNIKTPSNIYPWAFGLSSRVLKELASYIPLQEREKRLLVNFRHRKFNHSLRRFIEKNFIPEIQDFLPIDSSTDDLTVPPQDSYHFLRWTQTGRRHFPDYYRRLRESLACACFGGYFLPPSITDHHDKTSYYLTKLLSKIGLKTNRIGQWDSWRFWESLAAGCVTFHVDFEKYGFEMPISPVNWEHYIGIDLDNIQNSIDRIVEQPEILEKISISGRIWAIENYSPKAVALRFLNKVSNT
jgi:hypothetical protein